MTKPSTARAPAWDPNGVLSASRQHVQQLLRNDDAQRGIGPRLNITKFPLLQKVCKFNFTDGL